MPYLYRSAVILLSLAALTFFVDSTSAAAFKRIAHGDKAPPFSLPDTDGNPVNLEEYADGPLTILAFWATWSPKSGPLLEEVQKLVDEFGKRGLKALAVNAEGADTPPDLETQIASFVQEHGLKFPVVLDKGLEEYNTWGVIALPATAFLGEGLEVGYEFSGHPTSAYQDMRVEVMKALGIEEEVAEAVKPKRERYHADKKVALNYGLAKNLYERGQLSKAVRKLAQVLEDDPQFPDAHALSGAIHLAQSKTEGDEDAQKAREAFAKAVELDGTVPLGLAGLAHFALVDQDPAKALELSRNAVEHTEIEDLPVLPPPRGGDEGAIPQKLEKALTAESPDAAAKEALEEGKEAVSGEEGATPSAGEGQAEPTALAYLDRARAALDAGNAEEAASEIRTVVDGLIAVPEAPSGKGGMSLMERMEQMKKKAQSP